VEIGFIGLGHMGFPMARRLIEANNRVVAFDTRAEALDRVVALGAQAASSPKEVADLVETVMASLPSPQAALDVATSAPAPTPPSGRMILSLEKNNAYSAYRQL
jgi:3-hydroxyisobutyrate dehydrogenase-like beta-hydroxyacid dehydrogenase